MSHTHHTSASSSNFQLIFDNALKAYEKRTKKDLLTHPLAAQLQRCNSPSSILDILQEQVQELNQSQRRNERWTRWLDPTVKVLHAFSETLGKSVTLAFPPAKAIFTAVGVLLLAAKKVRASQGALFELFERLEAFFQRLEIYTEAALDQRMVDTVTKIMAEVLNIIGIATKEIKQGRTKKYLKKLFGNRTDIEDALKRLDFLTQEEAQMAAAQVLKATHAVDDTGRVRGVADIALSVDNRVADVGDQVQDVGDQVQDVGDQVQDVGDQVQDIGDRVQGVDDKVTATMDVMQQTADDVDEAKRTQLRQDLRRWLSPPDPSTNHNIACNAHHKGTATWFFEGRTYNEWKSTGPESLLWIHGKPGSGKSILCSTIIEDVKVMCNAGQASIAYFYFDFRDINKQHWRDLVPSFLTQLSTQSGPCCDILSRLYSDHGNGAQQPNDDALRRCLIEMLTVRDRHPIYLIMDALDECPDTSEVPSPRNRILQLLEELAGLQIPNLRICVTSRPEFDIRDFLEPLTSRQVSVVYLKSEPYMRRWRKEDKEFVIETLSERADGMFRWIFCQLEVLRQCLPPSVRPTLRELPESLDMTYERILKEIKKPNKRLAQRVLQCLVVAVRPLRVDELVEVLAVDFDDAEGIPRSKADWRWEEQELALLSACSSLIAIVQGDDSRVVQFSHFSVKEFLTSPRLATASAEVSNYHIDLEPAHTILGQACLGVLLQIQDDVEGCTPEDHPLARYAAEHWATHAQFGEVSSRLHKGMEYFFDANKPHFEVWLSLWDIDTRPNGYATFYYIVPDDKSPAAPLYYAALCGFHDLVEDLITKYPHDVNAHGGHYVSPLVAALAGEHFQTADLLRRNGADPNVRGYWKITPLHSAAMFDIPEVIRKLIEYGADINAENEGGYTPLHCASEVRHSKDSSVVQFLLEHGAGVNVRAENGSTPLYMASYYGELESVRLLLEHGADVEAKNIDGKTALQVAADGGHDEVVKLLREHGAK
ncbi:hypothetical protein F5888DRAFT_1803244 [Russula emetica]|nr:hypothetical protein F5888DRAFT_1803244 [Russula emetica]